jgi:hypothetical protein
VLEAGVRDECVEATEALERGVDRGAVGRARRQIRGERLAGPVGVRRDVDREDVPASATSRSATARPIPLAAPVTSAASGTYGPPRT